MRRLYSVAVLLSVLLLVFPAKSHAADAWKSIPLNDAGTVSIPSSWTVLQTNQPKAANAYGNGVFARTCLSAQASGVSLAILEYGLFSVPKHEEEITARKFTGDMATEMVTRYEVPNASPTQSKIKVGSRLAFTSAYNINPGMSQTIASFFHGGKIYCLIISYVPSGEYNATKLLRQIISRWKF